MKSKFNKFARITIGGVGFASCAVGTTLGCMFFGGMPLAAMSVAMPAAEAFGLAALGGAGFVGTMIGGTKLGLKMLEFADGYSPSPSV